jgi:hypothetical protein
MRDCGARCQQQTWAFSCPDTRWLAPVADARAALVEGIEADRLAAARLWVEGAGAELRRRKPPTCGAPPPLAVNRPAKDLVAGLQLAGTALRPSCPPGCQASLGHRLTGLPHGHQKRQLCPAILLPARLPAVLRGDAQRVATVPRDFLAGDDPCGHCLWAHHRRPPLPPQGLDHPLAAPGKLFPPDGAESAALSRGDSAPAVRLGFGRWPREGAARVRAADPSTVAAGADAPQRRGRALQASRKARRRPANPAPTAARALIVPMSSRLAIPRRVAHQQSPPALRQPARLSNRIETLATIFRPTATCPLPVCLTTGVQSTAPSPWRIVHGLNSGCPSRLWSAPAGSTVLAVPMPCGARPVLGKHAAPRRTLSPEAVSEHGRTGMSDREHRIHGPQREPRRRPGRPRPARRCLARKPRRQGQNSVRSRSSRLTISWIRTP